MILRGVVRPRNRVGVAILLGAIVSLGLGGCGASQASSDGSQAAGGMSTPLLIIRDGRTLCDLDSLAGVGNGGETELRKGIETALVCETEQFGQVMAYEFIEGGRRQLAIRSLETGQDRVVCEDIVRIVGFGSSGDLYYIARDDSDSVMTLMRYDGAREGSSPVDEVVIDARVDTESSAVAYLRATSDVSVDPVETELMFLAKPGATPIRVDTFEDTAFGSIGMVTPEAVAYVRHSGAGEEHGDVRIFDASTGTSSIAAAASRVAAVSPQRDAMVLGAYAVVGDIAVDDLGSVAGTEETIHLARLDGAESTQSEVPGEPIVGDYVYAAFAGDAEHVIVVANNADGNDAVYYLDMLNGTQRCLFETRDEGISEAFPLPDDGRVVCVVASRDPGGDSFRESVVILSLDDPDAEPVRIDGPTGSTLDIVGALPVKGGD